jgi:mRNA interferase RelE/StbE
LPSALREWRKLGAPIRDQFRKKLEERLAHPRVPASRLSDMPDCYKIKLRAVGYRLVYRVDDNRVTVIVVAVGRRERNAVYSTAASRLPPQ